MRFVTGSVLGAVVAGGLLIAGLGTGAALAQSAIKVVVNNEAITTNEINQRARFLRLVARDVAGPQLVRMATDEMIEEKLKLQEAKRLKMSVTEQQVDQAWAALASRVKLQPAQLGAALGQQGIDAATLRQRLRTQILWQQLVISRFQKTVSIADSQVVEALEKQQSKDPTKAKPNQPDTTQEYALNQIILVVPGNNPNSAAARLKDAEAIRAKANGCEGLVDLVRGYKETVVKNVGKRTEDELPDAFRAVVAETPVGKLTKPQRTGNGVEMLAICSKREIQGNLAVRSEVEGNLREQEGNILARQYIGELRRIAVVDYK